jgi:hypothetical protein
MSTELIAERTFTPADQRLFAELSSDRNPIHMPTETGVRTLSEVPIVHGVHTLLWVLESLFQSRADLGLTTSLRVRFENRLHVGENVSIAPVDIGEGKLRLNVQGQSKRIASIHLAFREPVADRLRSSDRKLSLLRPSKPQSMGFAEISGCEGRIDCHGAPAEAGRLFPAAARVLGEQRLAGLCGTSFLVGMVCPGLHSLYAGLRFFATSSDILEPADLDFRVVASDPRFKLVSMEAEGSGWKGSIDALCYARADARSEPGGEILANSVRTLATFR